MERKAISFCRMCGAACGVQLTLGENNRIVDIRGDKSHPSSHGYTCFKGLQAEGAYHGKARLIRPQRRTMDGSFEEIGLTAALDEIGERLNNIVVRDGGNAVAVMAGGGSYLDSAGHPMYKDFLRAIGSDQNFTVSTIDQSAKVVSFERLGGWAAGTQDLEHSDVVLLVGTNPVVAHTTVALLTTDPSRRLKQAKARGTKIICIDPRRNETSHYADLILQPLPGNDAAMLAGMIRIILAERWHDQEFCARHVGADRLDRLCNAVDGFAEDMVERRAGLEPGQLRMVAVMFARDHKRGAVFTATGPSMGPFSNLMQHLADCLNVICGRLRRAGDKTIVNPRDSAQPIHAEVIPPTRSWTGQTPSRLRGVRTMISGERMTGTLADEILVPGPGQIRALIVDGANAANCIPDAKRVQEAFKSLELLVVIDPYQTVTARLAHYILPPLMPYERSDLPIYAAGYPLQNDSYLQCTNPAFPPPAGSEVIDAWRFYWEMAARLGKQIAYCGKFPLDMHVAPSRDDLLALLMRGAAVDLDDVRQYPSGKLYDLPHAMVQPARPGQNARFDVMPDDVATECAELLQAEPVLSGSTIDGRRFTHILSSRRLRDVHNSSGTMLETIRRRLPYNPAFLNPADMQALSLRDGDRIEITSSKASVHAVVKADSDLRRGVINLSHGWGGLPDDDGGREDINVNLLTDSELGCQAINAMPRMSAIPVSIARLKG